MNQRVPPTEEADPATADLDALRGEALVEVLVAAQARAAAAAAAAVPELGRAVETIAERLRAGGRLHYAGAGTSGRLGALDAAECPPTFGTSPELVVAHIAGGPGALVRAVEGAEDDGAAGATEAAQNVASADAVVGISASGSARYVVAFVEAARARGAATFALTADPNSALALAADNAIVIATGAEPLAGSTRMVAGTAQKIVLGALSTAIMVRLGKVHGNLMVDVTATNAKLRARAIRLVAQLAPCDSARAAALLEASGGGVKVAVVMARCDADAATARTLLEREAGFLRPFLR
ncbi:MAG: N-acetylmuramic acid 6-phosphate etherase [Candidatus Eremiobacteraeota bacterium]|nr:N-acetylmuramic acid 6-phosphate etherase [Candidatus Eremiobacteraeota bacterium]